MFMTVEGKNKWERSVAALGLLALSCAPGSHESLPPVQKPPILLPSDPRMVPDLTAAELSRDPAVEYGPQLPSPDIFIARWRDWKARVEGVGGRVELYEANTKIDVLISGNGLLPVPDVSGRIPPRKLLRAGGPFPIETILTAEIGADRWVFAGLLVDAANNRLLDESTALASPRAALIQKNNDAVKIVIRGMFDYRLAQPVNWGRP